MSALDIMARFRDYADEHGAIVDRIEVMPIKTENGPSVAYTAYLLPKPLVQSTICLTPEDLAE